MKTNNILTTSGGVAPRKIGTYVAREEFNQLAQPATRHVHGYSDEHELKVTRRQVYLSDYWQAMKRRWWLPLLMALLVTTATAVYMANQPDVYRAQARVEIGVDNSIAGNTDVGKTLIVDRDPTQFNTQLQILASSSLLRRVVKTLNLEQSQAFLPNKKSGTQPANQSGVADNIENTNPLTPASERENLVEARKLAPYVALLQRQLVIDPIEEPRRQAKETRLVDLSFTHTDPRLATQVVNTVADVFRIMNLERKTSTNETQGDFLQQRIAELQAQIRSGEERLISYAHDNRILSLDPTQNTVVERLTGLNRQLLEAENERKQAEAAYRASQAPNAANALITEKATGLSEIQSKLNGLRQRRAELLVRNTQEWPEVKEVTRQIDELERQLQEQKQTAVKNLTTNLQTNYQSALQREQSLRGAFEAQRGQTLTQNEAAINYRIIQQEIETNRRLLDGMLQRAKENGVAQVGMQNNIHVIDYATTPAAPVGPKRNLSIILALCGSLIIGLGLTLLLDRFDDSFRAGQDVKELLNLQLLATIPTAKHLNEHTFATALPVNEIKNTSENAGALVPTEQHSAVTEAFRRLRTSVLYSHTGTNPQVLLITSSVPKEGKTTTATNLALSLSQTGVKVLLIDADLQHPQLHSKFNISNNKGLSTILALDMGESEMLSQLERYESSNFYLLTSGPAPHNVTELLGSQRMANMLKTLRSNFDYIVIDSPPVTTFSDGLILSALADGVVLVVHGGKTSRTDVQDARELLQNVGANVYGVVLNNVKNKEKEHYYQQNI